jgi:hypothetical protein
MKKKHVQDFSAILEPAGQLAPVQGVTFDPEQFPVFLRDRLQGKTIAEAADFLGITPKDCTRLIAGQWRPSERICRLMGLRVAYTACRPVAEPSVTPGARVRLEGRPAAVPALVDSSGKCPKCGERLKAPAGFHRRSDGELCVLDPLKAVRGGVISREEYLKLVAA